MLFLPVHRGLKEDCSRLPAFDLILLDTGRRWKRPSGNRGEERTAGITGCIQATMEEKRGKTGGFPHGIARYTGWRAGYSVLEKGNPHPPLSNRQGCSGLQSEERGSCQPASGQSLQKYKFLKKECAAPAGSGRRYRKKFRQPALRESGR